jgi:hypothetical protein
VFFLFNFFFSVNNDALEKRKKGLLLLGQQEEKENDETLCMVCGQLVLSSLPHAKRPMGKTNEIRRNM